MRCLRVTKEEYIYCIHLKVPVYTDHLKKNSIGIINETHCNLVESERDSGWNNVVPVRSRVCGVNAVHKGLHATDG